MHQVHLTAANYRKAKRQADKAGFKTVDDFVNQIIGQKIESEVEDLDHLFTAEVIAELDSIMAEIDGGGRLYSEEEVAEHLEATRKAWRAKRAG